MSDDKPIEVAIIGGGCAAISTAFELTRPEHEGKYHVTLYQVGWRLGGKGASGRGPSGRIEEHGLHIWLGFYENAFRLLREAYAELDRDPADCPIADWRDAFDPDPWVGVADKSKDEWQKWLAYFPPGEGNPGDPFRDHNPFSVRGYMSRSVELVRTLLVAVQNRHMGSDSGGAGTAESPVSASTVSDAIGRILRYGQLATLAAVVEAIGLLGQILESVPVPPRELLLKLLEAIAGGARSQLEQLIDADDDVRRLWEMVDLSLAILRGLIRYNVANDPRGFDAVNDYDCKEWLRLNGASEASIDSAIVRGLYDLAFAYEDGDFERPALAAGQGIRGSVRMFFTYRGSLFWKMRAGMGDIVFAPFYEVLSRRGVSFKFFHRLRNIELADRAELAEGERPYVKALEFDVQAKVKGGGEYQPLVDVRGLPCWPAEPDWDQLAYGARYRKEGWKFESHWDERCAEAGKRLEVIDDFDFVVLGVGVGAVPHVARELVESDPRWRSMVQNVKTVATQAFQIWMDEDMEELGWEGPPTTLSGFVTPFDTWADMRQLIPYEDWSDELRSIAYFCCVLPTLGVPADATDRLDPAEYRDQVRANAIRFLNNDVEQLWPNAVERPGRFRWDLLLAADGHKEKDGKKGGSKKGKADESRFDTQFWTANVNPSDRYVLALPGSLKHRISPLDPTYDNLTIAGDWTDCGFNEGCVEAAVMSGRLAAHAISRLPRLEEIVGYDHP